MWLESAAGKRENAVNTITALSLGVVLGVFGCAATGSATDQDVAADGTTAASRVFATASPSVVVEALDTQQKPVAFGSGVVIAKGVLVSNCLMLAYSKDSVDNRLLCDALLGDRKCIDEFLNCDNGRCRLCWVKIGSPAYSRHAQVTPPNVDASTPHSVGPCERVFAWVTRISLVHQELDCYFPRASCERDRTL